MDARPHEALRAVVLHDRQAVLELVQVTLNHGLFVVRPARDLAEAEAILAEWHPDITVIDMDHEDSAALLDKLAPSGSLTRNATPVLGLTRRSDLQTKLAAFARGVDDILTLPCAPEELLARCIVIGRRASGIHLPIVPTIALGGMEIDIVHRAVRIGDTVVRLSTIEQSLLYLLASRSGRFVTREEILDAVWGTDFVAESNIVDRHVRSLRIKLQDDCRHPRFIATVPGRGYRFVPTFSNSGWVDGPETPPDDRHQRPVHERRHMTPTRSPDGDPDGALEPDCVPHKLRSTKRAYLD